VSELIAKGHNTITSLLRIRSRIILNLNLLVTLSYVSETVFGKKYLENIFENVFQNFMKLFK